MSAQPIDRASAALDAARKAGADAADAIFLESTDIAVGQRMGKPEEIERSESAGIGLRVWAGTRQASVTTVDMRPQALAELAELAVAMAREAPEDPHGGLAAAELLAKDFPDLDLADPEEPTTERLMEGCAIMEEIALSGEGITNSEGAQASYGARSVALATSAGFAGSYRSTSFSRSVTVLAGEGTKMERDYAYSVSRYLHDIKQAETLGYEAASRTRRRLGATSMKTGRLPVVLDPRVGRQLVGKLAGALNGSSIARGTSFLKGAMGQRILPAHLSLVDEPHRRRGLGSRPFDGEGVAADVLALVEEGVLSHWLLDTRAASQLGLVTNGRASRGLSGAPSPATTNLSLQGGTVPVKELIGGIARGFYVTDTFGMGVNLVTGDYSQGAAGFLIENGEITRPISEVTIAGELKAMLAGMEAADDLVFEHGTNAPTLLIREMTVAGS